MGCRPSHGGSIGGVTAIDAGSRASSACRQLFLNCPRCGLSITPKAAWLAIERCPRCLADARLSVKLISSRPPAETQAHVGSDPITVHVEHAARGGWQVAMPNQSGRVRCETLDDARRIGYLCVAHTSPCELIVHDAYHRVIDHELIDVRPRGEPNPIETRIPRRT